jgi:predicted transposase/invertase (TIGR01784 family)
MLEYYALLLRKHRLPVTQFVVYLGQDKPTMETSWFATNITFNFTLKDVKEYDYQNLIASDIPEEVILAVLSDFQDQPPEEVIRLILERIVKIVPDKLKLQRYLRQLGVLSKLRNLQPLTFKKLDDMPIEYDIQTDYLFLKGKEAGAIEGVAEGMKEGRKEGRKEGQTAVIVNMLKSGKLNHAQIAEFTGLSVKKIKQVAHEHGL